MSARIDELEAIIRMERVDAAVLSRQCATRGRRIRRYKKQLSVKMTIIEVAEARILELEAKLRKLDNVVLIDMGVTGSMTLDGDASHKFEASSADGDIEVHGEIAEAILRTTGPVSGIIKSIRLLGELRVEVEK